MSQPPNRCFTLEQLQQANVDLGRPIPPRAITDLCARAGLDAHVLHVPARNRVAVAQMRLAVQRMLGELGLVDTTDIGLERS